MIIIQRMDHGVKSCIGYTLNRRDTHDHDDRLRDGFRFRRSLVFNCRFQASFTELRLSRHVTHVIRDFVLPDMEKSGGVKTPYGLESSRLYVRS